MGSRHPGAAAELRASVGQQDGNRASGRWNEPVARQQPRPEPRAWWRAPGRCVNLWAACLELRHSGAVVAPVVALWWPWVVAPLALCGGSGGGVVVGAVVAWWPRWWRRGGPAVGSLLRPHAPCLPGWAVASHWRPFAGGLDTSRKAVSPLPPSV
jgi:hypothetical protein